MNIILKKREMNYVNKLRVSCEHNLEAMLVLVGANSRAVHSGGAKGAVAPARKTKCFFSNIVSDFAGLFLVAILVRNLTKIEFAPADKKS